MEQYLMFFTWTEISLIEKVYWLITIPATVFFLAMLVMTLIGSDAHPDMDVDANVDSDISHGDSIPFQFISYKNLTAFFAVFGWSGIGFYHAGLPSAWVILLSVICGLLMMTLMATLFYFMSKLQESGTLKMKNAVGKLAEVYLAIPPQRKGMGKVQLTVQGSLRTLDAITNEPFQLPTSSIVRVTGVIDDQILLVTKSENQ